MVVNSPPIQEKTTEQSGLFPQTWLRWFLNIYNNLSALYSTSRSTSDVTADGSTYHWFCNTDAGDVNITLPAGEQGSQFRIVNTGSSGGLLTISPNGSDNLLGDNSDFILNDGESLVIFYDETDGWF